MTLDRQSIEKRDFPIARRGYDTAGVDAHLARLADELDAMRREGDRAATGGVAGNASAHVQQIVEVAETTAEQLMRDAQGEAAELRERAAGEAQRARQEALEESREHVAKVGEATTRMLQRVEAMDSELGTMIDNLRTGVNRLVADLALLEGNIADLHEQHGGVAPVGGPSHVDWDHDPELHGETVAIDEEPTPSPETDAEVIATESEPEVPLSSERGGDVAIESDLGYDSGGESDRDTEASARIVALDLALGGSDREQIKQQLGELFGELPDVDRLLDDVFTSIDA